MRKLISKNSSPPQEYPVGTGLTIGSKPSNTIQIKNSKVDAEHARILKSGEHVYVEDLDSRYGLTVNGKKVRRWALKPQDIIEIAGMEMLYAEDDQPEPSPAQAPRPEVAPQPDAKAAATGKPAGAKSGVKTAVSSGIRTKATTPQGSVASAAPTTSSAGSGRTSAIAAASPTPAAKPATQRLQVVSTSKPPGASSARTRADSARFAEIAEAALKAKERADTGRQAAQAPKERKPLPTAVVIGAAVLLLTIAAGIVVYAVTHTKSVRGNATVAEREAIERLRVKGPKDGQDLAAIRLRLQKVSKWADVEELLGEPDLTAREKIPLYESDRGTYDFPGNDFRAYYVKDATDSANNPNCDLASILLFEIGLGGSITCYNTRNYARKVLPPIAKPGGPEPKTSGDEPAPNVPKDESAARPTESVPLAVPPESELGTVQPAVQPPVQPRETSPDKLTPDPVLDAPVSPETPKPATPK